jgi:hypothetical protein
VLHYVETQGRQNLRERLKEGYRMNAERDLDIAAAWFPLMVTVAPTRTNGLSVLSAIHLGQIPSVGRQRLVKRLGSVDEATMGKVDEALQISLGRGGVVTAATASHKDGAVGALMCW